MGLALGPISLKDANAFVAEHHRHHKPVRGHRFAIAAYSRDDMVGVVIVGRPVSRCVDATKYCEVTRLCTNGHRNACSFLYAAARRAAASLGYARLLTYTLPSEGGASLKAAGFDLVATTRGGSWDTPARRRIDQAPITPKHRWEIAA